MKGFSDERLASILDTMRAAGESYGRPHLHSGIGLRVIGDFIECRDALDYRLVFQRKGGALVFSFYGNHDQVRAYVKNAR
jgi:hypothetical protein